MKYFLDTEFSERGPRFPVELISIGIVAEDGREFYAHSANYDIEGCSDWVKLNVLPHVQMEAPMSLWSIAESVRLFIGDDSEPEFWGYYADYDWVVFCQIFGTMMDLPKGFPMYCRDIKQWADQPGNQKLPEQSTAEHNALNDARWNKLAWDHLNVISEDTYIDERGTAWTRPTAYAYFAACRALSKAQQQLPAAARQDGAE